MTSLGKMSKCEPGDGNFVGDDTCSEEDDQTHEERTLEEEAMGWNQHPTSQL